MTPRAKIPRELIHGHYHVVLNQVRRGFRETRSKTSGVIKTKTDFVRINSEDIHIRFISDSILEIHICKIFPTCSLRNVYNKVDLD